MFDTFDWGTTPLGPRHRWSPALQATYDMIMASPFAMCVGWGPGLTLLYNEPYAPFLAGRHPAALGQPIEAVWSDVWDDIRPLIEDAMAGRVVRHEDMPLIMTRKGEEESTFWTFAYSALRDEGTVIGFLNIAIETTATVLAGRRRDAAELASQERALGMAHVIANSERVQLALAAGAILGTWVWDIPTDRFTVDEAFAANFGLDPALGRTGIALSAVVQSVHPDDRAGLAEAIEAAVARGGRYAHTYRVRRSDGQYRWLEANGHVEHAPDGTPLRFPGVLINMEERQALIAERDRVLTELRQLNETLERRVEERTRDLLESQDLARLALSSVGGVGAWSYDVTTDLFFCSPAISELYGLDPVRGAGGIERAAFLANVHPEDLPRLRAVMTGGLTHEGDIELEYRIRHPDGSVRWVLSRGHTYADEGGRMVRRVGVGVDTTRQREMEEQLRQSQKMEAVGQLTGGLAHDFNNLLAGISGSLELMNIRISQGRLKDVERYMVAAQGAARRAAALTHRLLAFSRRQTLAPRATDIVALTDGMLDLVRRTVGPGVAVEVVAAPGLWPTLVDPSQLENALLNLCINARDAMPGGGRITVEASNRRVDGHTARQQDTPEGEFVSLSVTDTGTGMPPEVIAKAFDPFFTTKPIGQGTGLGLSMIYGFAKQSGGQVRIQSQVGQGTTVRLYLPRHRGEAEDAQEVRAGALRSVAEEGETVLVVDDEPTIRILVADVLGDLGYTAVEAVDGAGALNVLQSNARIDLLITDVGLPGGLNGKQVADAARVTRPELKVLFITGYAENALIGDEGPKPGMAVLTKPFAVETLATRIREVTMQSSAQSSSQAKDC